LQRCLEEVALSQNLSTLFWRHPKPRGAVGLCLGQTDLRCDPRKTKRLARRIQVRARRLGLPKLVITSPLQRCAGVGQWLKRWGWQHRIDAQLLEMNFGTWDGRPWSEIDRSAIDAWCDNFPHYRPGAGECLADILARASAWQSPSPCMVVTHGGWLQARQWVRAHPLQMPAAKDWQPAPSYNSCYLETP
jgi:alpha-ribazole phosphatase